MKYGVFVMLVILLGITSCSHTLIAPSDSVPRRTKFDQDPFGGYIKITCKDSTRFEGELIGARNDSVVVIKSKPASFAKSEIARATVIMYNPGEYGWGYLGILVTPLDGPFLVLTAPLWIISTTSAITGEDTPNYKTFPVKRAATPKGTMLVSESDAWKEVLKYSRFPAGIPENIRLAELKGRQK